ncbi:MAG TPA: delta-60 repeat domain-containing protein, partial [Blastocatellia bacterium]
MSPRAHRAMIRPYITRPIVAVVLSALLLPIGIASSAAGHDREKPQQTAGTLDPSFGTAGIVTTSFNEPAVGQGIAQQSDGKLVLAGFLNPGGGSAAAFSEVARYNTDGSLDTTFGTGGTTMISDFLAFALALAPNGQIVVAGAANLSDRAGNFGVARLNTDGSLDTTFGGGVVSTTFTTGTESIPLA